MQVKLETITPKKAEEMLGTNRENRHIRAVNVTMLAQQILNGDWSAENPAPISFDSDGHLIDGQHRLAAIIEAKKSAKMWVATGIKRDVSAVIDTGASRKMGDILRMKGEKNASNLASALRQLWMWENLRLIGGGSGRMKPTHLALLRLLDANPDLRTFVNSVGSEWKGYGPKLGLPPSIITATYYICSAINEEDADTFFWQLRTGDTVTQGNALYALRRQLLRTPSLQRRTARSTAALIFKTWNIWREGTEVDVVIWKGGGRNPEPFPNPEG